jgi:hypothetical protein
METKKEKVKKVKEGGQEGRGRGEDRNRTNSLSW